MRDSTFTEYSRMKDLGGYEQIQSATSGRFNRACGYSGQVPRLHTCNEAAQGMAFSAHEMLLY